MKVLVVVSHWTSSHISAILTTHICAAKLYAPVVWTIFWRSTRTTNGNPAFLSFDWNSTVCSQLPSRLPSHLFHAFVSVTPSFSLYRTSTLKRLSRHCEYTHISVVAPH